MQSFGTLLVIRQIALCPFDIPFLCVLASGTEQRNHITGLGEIDPKSWPEIEAQFVDATSYRTVVSQKPQTQPTKAVFHSGLRSNVFQCFEPLSERLSAVWAQVDFNNTLHHYSF